MHVGLHENYPYGGSPTGYTERLSLHSNASAYDNGDIAQHWFIYDGDETDENVPISLSFHLDSADVERVALASVFQSSPTRDLIYIDSCVAIGCTNRVHHHVELPSSWDTYSVISDIEILGIDQTLYLSFIGDDHTTPNIQVYIKQAYSSSAPKQISEDLNYSKWNLEMTAVNNREPSWLLTLPATAWIESIGIYQHKYIVYDGWDVNTMVFQGTCVTNTRYGHIHSNGYYFSGVWDFCGDTWFSTQAWTNQLLLIMK